MREMRVLSSNKKINNYNWYRRFIEVGDFMKKEHLKKRISKEKWAMRLEDNVKRIYDYDKQCIQFLQKYDIAERKFM